jgi:xanthine dehydrogenase accessory factor
MRLADLAAFNAARAARRPVLLVTDISRGDQRVVAADAVAGDDLAVDLAERLRLGKSGLVHHRGRDIFVTVHVPAVRVITIGAVHISQALAAMARLVELDMIIVDPRTAFATPERFPDTTLIAEWPADVLPALKLDAYTAVALLTHDPKIDDQALVAALQARCFYIGALGSRKTHAQRLDRMRAEGIGDDELGRIHAPIGLDIGAVSPAEIAVAILGEIIAALRRKPLRSEASSTKAGTFV